MTSIKVFPNPASSYCTIEANNLTDAKVRLTDLMGRSVALSIISQSESSISINTENLDSGIYFIVINKEEVVTTRKLIVE